MRALKTGAVLALLTASTWAAAASGAPSVAKQRVAITIKPGRVTTTFVLQPLTPGAVQKDAGRVTFKTSSENVGVREGQRIRFWGGTAELAGEHGSLGIRMRVEWRDAGYKHEAGWGTWKVVRGSGDYAHVSGSGGSAHVWTPRGPAAAQAEGFLTYG